MTVFFEIFFQHIQVIKKNISKFSLENFNSFKLKIVLIFLMFLTSCEPASMKLANKKTQLRVEEPLPVEKLSFPKIISEPLLSVGADSHYEYQIALEYSPDYEISYKLEKSPKFMTINNNGLLTWAPSSLDIGEHLIEISVHEKNQLSNSASQIYILTVVPYCQLQKSKLALYLDRNLDGSEDDGAFVSYVNQFLGPLSAIDNYGYKWWAPHISYGPRGDFFTVSSFFYEGSDGLYFYSLIYRPGGGAILNHTNVKVWIEGNEQQDHLVFNDDPDGILYNKLLKRYIIDKGTYYQGRIMNIWRGDGFIIGPLKFNEDFKLVFRASNKKDMKFFSFYENDGRQRGKRFSFSEKDDSGAWPQFVIKKTKFVPCSEI